MFVFQVPHLLGLALNLGGAPLLVGHLQGVRVLMHATEMIALLPPKMFHQRVGLMIHQVLVNLMLMWAHKPHMTFRLVLSRQFSRYYWIISMCKSCLRGIFVLQEWWVYLLCGLGFYLCLEALCLHPWKLSFMYDQQVECLRLTALQFCWRLKNFFVGLSEFLNSFKFDGNFCILLYGPVHYQVFAVVFMNGESSY